MLVKVLWALQIISYQKQCGVYNVLSGKWNLTRSLILCQQHLQQLVHHTHYTLRNVIFAAQHVRKCANQPFHIIQAWHKHMETHASGPPCRYVLGDRVCVFCITFVYGMCQMCGIVQYDHSVDAHVQHIIVSCCPERQLFWLPCLVLMVDLQANFPLLQSECVQTES